MWVMLHCRRHAEILESLKMSFHRILFNAATCTCKSLQLYFVDLLAKQLRTTSLFNSLCIHTICLRRSKDTVRKLAEYRAQLCLLGLRELQKTWDVTNWVLQLFLQFLDQSTAKKLQIATDNDDAVGPPTASGTPRLTAADSESSLTFDQSQMSAQGYTLGRSDDIASQSIAQGLDFSSHLFGTKEAEDFSMFQLQPDLFSGDVFGGGLDQYYSSILPRGDGAMDDSEFQ